MIHLLDVQVAVESDGSPENVAIALADTIAEMENVEHIVVRTAYEPSPTTLCVRDFRHGDI